MRKVILGTLGVLLAGGGLATAQSKKPTRSPRAGGRPVSLRVPAQSPPPPGHGSGVSRVRPVGNEAAAEPGPVSAWDKPAAGCATDHEPLPVNGDCGCDVPYRVWGNFEFLVWFIRNQEEIPLLSAI